MVSSDDKTFQDYLADGDVPDDDSELIAALKALPDDDPDVVAGMEKLRILREQEGEIQDLPSGDQS